jgi:hypothetical protein
LARLTVSWGKKDVPAGLSRGTVTTDNDDDRFRYKELLNAALCERLKARKARQRMVCYNHTALEGDEIQ